MSILENFSRMLLASTISEGLDTTAYLRVRASALRNYGTPEAIITDSGGVFYSKYAMAIYEVLDIRKERIDPRQSWQNYREAHLYVIWNLSDRENCQITYILWTWDDQREEHFHRIYVQLRMADWSFEKAQAWEVLLAAHEKWHRDYNFQKHLAHVKREAGCHSPAEVPGWVKGMQPEPDLVYRAFSAICETRTLTKASYARFRNFLLYGEQGLLG